MKTLRAVIAGILGAVAMSLAMLLLRLGGINISLEALLGTIFNAPDGMSEWTLGFLIHLMVGAVAGLLYAAVFEVAVQRSGPLIGGGLGLCHGLIAGLIMSGIPAMNPMTTAIQSPGPFLQNMTLGPLVFLLLHCLFGVVAGAVYGKPLQKPHRYTHRTT